MGRPRHTPPARPGGNRRDFFKRSGSAATAMVSLSGMLPLATHGAVIQTVFQHGVASGDPLADRVILWTRVTPAQQRSSINVGYVVATDPLLTQVVQRGTTKTNPARDNTVKIDAAGLQPGTTYYYRFSAEGATSPVGRTRTLPVGSAQRLRIAVMSCSNHAYGYFNAYARVAERADLDLIVHLGDYLYEYGPNVYGTTRTPEPPGEIVTLADYRARHAQYKRDADSQAMLRQHPLVAIWDDHETTNDAWKDGAENHTPGEEGDWATRVNAALQAYYEWMPVRVVDPAVRRNNARAFRFGNLLELVMLEERLTARSQQLPFSTAPGSTPFGPGFVQSGAFTDPARTLLGDTQEAWLADRLRTTPARWKFLGQGVMFAQLKGVASANSAGGGVFLNSDQWDGYQPARNRIYDIINGNASQPGVGNVVVLTGDIHSSWAADLTQDPNNPNVASGGYNPATGAGSRAVEFVGTSVTSPGVDTDTSGGIAGFLRSINPHFKYINLNRRGYMLIDVVPERVTCEWWFVDTVASPSPGQSFAVAFKVEDGTQRLTSASQTMPPASPPALAP
jgi:alkaline phosphatase D